MLERDERIERLINRRIDGVLSSDEGLELDRALIRSPEHRRTLEAAQRIEGLCSDALAGITDVPSTLVVENLPQQVMRRATGRMWWSLPAAMAAGLAFLVITGRGPIVSQNQLSLVDVGPIQSADAPPIVEADRAAAPIDARQFGIQQASGLGHTTDRRLDRRIYGVPVGSDNLLLIEVERTRMYQYPRRSSKNRLVHGDL